MRTVVAFLAQERSTRLQQRRNVGTVRRMAVGAILGCGLVFPQEGSAFFRMAGEASFNHRGLLQHLGTGRTVRIVAVGADDLARINRVSGYLVGVSALILVAGEANFGLRLPVAYFIHWSVYFVAIVAGHLIVIVLATIPVGAIGTLVTAQALACTNFAVRHFKGALLENDVRCGAALDAGITVQVF